MTRTYMRGPCRVCGAEVSNNGMATASHERGKQHIDALRATGREGKADILQAQADEIKANNKRGRAEGTYGYGGI